MKEYPKFLLEELQKVDDLIKNSISSNVDKISLISNYIINAGGKRIRPVFALLAANLFEIKSLKHIHIATAVEFIHTATLLHDDVIDESKMRRGKEVANLKWGNQVAILVGDFLFAQSFNQMVLTDSLEVMGTLSKASSIIAEGEVEQLENISNLHMTHQQYINIISRKTAALFAAACKCGAIITNQTLEVKNNLYNFGLNIGIAFQIIDDILDYISPKSGKDLGDDFKEGKVTLPVISVVEKLNQEEYKIFEKAFIKKDKSIKFTLVKEIIDSYGGYELARDTARNYLNSAKQILEEFPLTPARETFKNIMLQQINRLN